MSGPEGAGLPDKLIREVEQRVRDQEARLKRMIVQGAPTQTAEDLLQKLRATLRETREHRHNRSALGGAPGSARSNG